MKAGVKCVKSVDGLSARCHEGIYLIILFTGEGKGKTSAAMGTVARALGSGKKVVVIQFMKGNISSEKKFFEDKNCEFYNFGQETLVNLKNPSDKDREECMKAFSMAKEKASEKPFLLVLDEINVAVSCNMLSKKEVIDFLKGVSPGTNIVLTGRYAPDEFIRIADVVT